MEYNNQDITFLKGVGEKRAKLFAKLGIFTVYDLLTFYPRGYVDFTEPVKICDLQNDESAVFSGTVTRKLKPFIGSRFSIYRAIISDETDELLLTFFNSEYTFAKLFEGKDYLFYGKVTGDLVKKECSSPVFIDGGSKNRLLPKYRLTAGLSFNILSGCVKNALELCPQKELLPEKLREEFGLCGINDALRGVHFPESYEQYEAVKKRLAFEELLVLQLGLSLLKSRNRKLSSVRMKKQNLDDFYASLPYSPTKAQRRAIDECAADMTEKTPMNRLLQGDVGSGKTLVAAAACLFAVKNGCQASLMAPTEILAQQHFKSLSDFLAPLGVKVALLTGSMSVKEKNEVKKQIKSGEAQVVTGTQALIQKGVSFNRLGLVVADEQHRFGVGQRSDFAGKGENPHNLVMSATPIPRTLALMIYGDLDISVLDEMPKGRLPIKTYGVDTSYRPRLYSFIRKYVADGKQAYIVCPMIEEGENDKAGAVKYFENIKQNYFPDIPIGLLHGKMKQAEKDAVMAAFKANELKILVSTTVIEVGVDVPNAVVMMIENAEQFGLSQLHQLRGRVGRGSVQSHCILVTDSDSGYTKSRIDTMVRTSDGFEVANTDLELRGPGDFFGSMQHGLPPLKIADMLSDTELLKSAQGAAKTILSADGTLSAPENTGLKTLVLRLFQNGERFGFN